MSFIKYVIIQAGGKGTRLGKYTLNKPKALLSINGVPILLNIIKTFPNSFYIIIGDYKFDILRNYLRSFCKERYVLTYTSKKGTCAGLKIALDYIPDNEPFIITWCDLYFMENFSLPQIDLNKNYIGISSNFECRWSYLDNKFIEKPSIDNGVAGFFIFSNKSILKDLPEEGEFVKYLSTKNLKFEKIKLYGVEEFGTKDKYEDYLTTHPVSRPFNKLEIRENRVIKIPIDKKGEELSNLEKNWYKHISYLKFEHIPQIYNLNPIEMEKIEGKHPFELSLRENIILNIIQALRKLHSLESPKLVNFISVYREYYQKTFERIYRIRSLLPFSDKKELKINDKYVLNPFYIEEEIEKAIKTIYPERFFLIHGDPTFSNTLIDSKGKVYFIDPRGYFGYTELYGDSDYDYAKLYYSLVGNYDKFNRKMFELKINENGGEIYIPPSEKEFENIFWSLIGMEKKFKIKLLHGIIWLSLTTYVWDDFDMICGAFLNGALKIKEVLYE